MRIIKDFKVEFILFISLILIQLSFFKLSIVFSHMSLIESIYLVILKVVVFFIYIVYKKWLFLNRLNQSIPFEAQKTIDDLKEKNKKLNKSIKEIKNANEAVNDIVYGYIHELKTPIAAIRLSEPPRFIQDEVFRLEAIIEKLLYMTRLKDIKNDVIINNYSMDQLVKNVIKKYKNIFIHKNISLTIEFDDFDLRTDQKWFEFALAQLMSNALKYTETSGTIVIRTDNKYKRKNLIIEDNGCGFPMGYCNRIFEKGFSFDQKNRNYKGTGIGLYLSKKIFDYLAIDCRITSIESQGTTVTLLMNSPNDFYNLT